MIQLRTLLQFDTFISYLILSKSKYFLECLKASRHPFMSVLYTSLMERTPLMEGKEFDMFIHGPFATGVYLDAGKLTSIDDDFLREFVGESKNQIRESKNQIIECSKDSIPYMKQRINGIKLVLRNDREVSNSIIYKFENNTINL